MIKGKEGNLLSRLKFKVMAVGGGWGPTRAKLGTLLVYIYRYRCKPIVVETVRTVNNVLDH
jgi:hypothetical protein